MASSADHLRAFTDLLSTTLTALSHFTEVLNPSNPTDTDVAIVENPPNPLHVLRDSASLVKAHTTKLSLLAINKPFTPSALTKVLQQLAATCLPAMMSAVHICHQERAVWGSTLEREVQIRVRRVMREMESLLRELQAIASREEEGAAKSKKGGSGHGTTGRDSLSSTGVVWESCDALLELEKLGVGGLAVQKAEQYRDTLRDAIEELKEWAEGEDTDTEGFDPLLDEGDEGVDGDRDSVEDMFHAANSLPPDREDLRVLVKEAGARLKKVVLLYTAVMKRRLKTWPSFPPSTADDEGEGGDEKGKVAVERLNAGMLCLKRIPHQVDELASCFYDLDEVRVKNMLKTCVEEARKARAAFEKNWMDQEDEFTAWSVKWLAAIGS